MTDETYNGWKNYPTWAVNLWMENDRGIYERALGVAQFEIEQAPSDENVREQIWTVEETERFRCADHMRAWHREVMDMRLDADDTEPDMFNDLLGWALEQVDWHEIAAHWIQSAKEIAEYEK